MKLALVLWWWIRVSVTQSLTELLRLVSMLLSESFPVQLNANRLGWIWSVLSPVYISSLIIKRESVVDWSTGHLRAKGTPCRNYCDTSEFVWVYN